MTTEDRPTPVVKAEMLIRRPVREVFEAFVDPAITCRFWFSRGSGRLEAGGTVRWDWEMFGVSADVSVLAIEQDRRILIEWDDPACPVEWIFTPRGDQTTLVSISNWGFQGSDESITAQAIDSKGGFTIVLAGLKALLEHGVDLDLIRDQYPDGLIHPPA